MFDVCYIFKWAPSFRTSRVCSGHRWALMSWWLGFSRPSNTLLSCPGHVNNSDCSCCVVGGCGSMHILGGGGAVYVYVCVWFSVPVAQLIWCQGHADAVRLYLELPSIFPHATLLFSLTWLLTFVRTSLCHSHIRSFSLFSECQAVCYKCPTMCGAPLAIICSAPPLLPSVAGHGTFYGGDIWFTTQPASPK